MIAQPEALLLLTYVEVFLSLSLSYKLLKKTFSVWRGGELFCAAICQTSGKESIQSRVHPQLPGIYLMRDLLETSPRSHAIPSLEKKTFSTASNHVKNAC